MFHIIILYIILDIHISFLGCFFEFFGFSVFRDTRSGSVNNASGSDMFYTTLQDPFGYFLHFGLDTDWVFRFGFGSDFGLQILCPCLILVQETAAFGYVLALKVRKVYSSGAQMKL